MQEKLRNILTTDLGEEIFAKASKKAKGQMPWA
jgi:hypothetical protein